MELKQYVKQLVVILLVLAAFGAAKLQFEDRLALDMREQQLIDKPLNQDMHARLGQTSYAVALGGLRSAVAAFMNLKAFGHYGDLEWLKVEQNYQTMQALQPQNTYYWDTGAWHMHTNAASYYRDNEELHPRRRKEMQQTYVRKGSKMLEEGVKINPDNWRLHDALAKVWSDRFKFPDYARATEHYQNAIACESMPEWRRKQFYRFSFYTMTRVPERQKEALQIGKELFKNEQNRTPNLVTCIYTLQHRLGIPEGERIPDEKLFPDKRRQLHYLTNYRKYERDGYPMDGVGWKIELLQKELSQPQKTPPTSPSQPE